MSMYVQPPVKRQQDADEDSLDALARGQWSARAFVAAVALYLVAVSIGVAAIFVVLATPY